MESVIATRARLAWGTRESIFSSPMDSRFRGSDG